MDMPVDIMEDSIVQYGRSLMEILLQDKTTKKRIIWATSDYESHGQSYKEHCEITVDSVTGLNNILIQPRVLKAKEHQSNRTRDKAEVFTPAWVCNEQNNLIDESWFGRKNVFNTPTDSRCHGVRTSISAAGFIYHELRSERNCSRCHDGWYFNSSDILRLLRWGKRVPLLVKGKR